jgi:uncharacterized membrane protein
MRVTATSQVQVERPNPGQWAGLQFLPLLFETTACMPTWITSRPRLIVGVLIGIGVYFLLPVWLDLLTSTRALIAWNAAASIYLLSAMHMMFSVSTSGIRQRALAQDEGQRVILGLVVLSAFVCLAAVVIELGSAKTMNGSLRLEHVAHAVLTIASSWFFTQVMFAQHYAHHYYFSLENQQPGGLQFPEEPLPDYMDFLYMSCVIGTSGQTADVTFTGRSMRRIGLLHCLLCFFFNTTVLALTVNMASSLI